MFGTCGLLTSYTGVSGWDVSSVTTMANMFVSSGLAQTDYDPILINWSALTLQADVSFHAGTAQYGAGAPTTARLVLTDPPNSWLITDGGAA